MQFTLKSIATALLLLLLGAAIVVLLTWLVPVLVLIAASLQNGENMAQTLGEMGSRAALVVVGLQMLQVVLVFFPAAPIQVMAGLCFGVWIGTLLCMVGFVLGNVIVLYIARHFKLFRPSQTPMADKKRNKWLNLQKLSQMKHPEYTAFLLFLMPGLPNGLLPYIFASTSITIPRYALSIATAAFPTLLIFAWLGESIATREYLAVLLIGLGYTIGVVCLFLFRKRILHFLSRFSAFQELDENDF